MSGGDPRSIVLVGGGLASAKCAEALRTSGYDGRLVLLAAEHQLPYERPPLSKGYLQGSEELEKAFVHDAGWYRDHDVELRLGAPARTLDVEGHTVSTDDEVLSYDRLLLATGATPRRLPMAESVRAHYLRTIEDSDRLKAVLTPGSRIAVLGAGWIGLEVAAAARGAGCAVVVVEPAAQPLLRVLGPEVGGVFAELHREHGVDLRTDTSPSVIAPAGEGVSLALTDGTSVRADALVVGIGATPRTRLAEAAGLGVDNGVVVDERLRTSHPDVFAAGDVANAFHPLLGRHVRVEHWDNAIAQGRAAAASMLGGQDGYDRLPYFFSDQYDLGMEYVGSTPSDGYDEVVLRGDVARRVFTAFWVDDGRVVAGMQANDWDATDDIRRIVAADGVDLDALRDPGVPLADAAH